MSPEFCMFFSDVDISKKPYMAAKRIVVFPDCIVMHDHHYSNRAREGVRHLYTIACVHWLRELLLNLSWCWGLCYS